MSPVLGTPSLRMERETLAGRQDHRLDRAQAILDGAVVRHRREDISDEADLADSTSWSDHRIFKPRIVERTVGRTGPSGGWRINGLLAEGPYLYADTGDGLFRSIDSGATWEALDAELPRTLTVHAFFGGEAGLFAGTGRGVFLSRDNGRSWASASPGEIEVYDLAATVSSLFAGTEDGVFVTQDDGKNWSKTNLVLPRFSDVSSLAVLETALVADTDEGTFVTHDSGETWLEIDSDQIGDFDWDEIAVMGEDLFSRWVRRSSSVI